MSPWNKGKTKFTDVRVMNTSKTLAAKQHSNFWNWQQRHRVSYKPLKRGKDLAELYGTLLGDGCIERGKRTDKLTISFNRKEQAHIAHVEKIINKLFCKAPTIRVRKQSRCDDVYLYQKFIQQRLRFPYGKKLLHPLKIPHWIMNNREYIRLCLKGLFETDGDHHIDQSNHTNVMKFTNLSQILLDDVVASLQRLGYHPQRRQGDVRLARHHEVEKFVKWIAFRTYPQQT